MNSNKWNWVSSSLTFLYFKSISRNFIFAFYITQANYCNRYSMARIVKFWSANKCDFERKSSKLHRYLLTGAIVFIANVAESVDRERTKKWLSITVTHEQTKGPRRCIGYDPLFEQVTAGFAITSVAAIIFARHVHVSLIFTES